MTKIVSELDGTVYGEGDITFFPERMTDDEKRSEVDRVGVENGCSAVILEDFVYSKGMVGYILSADGERKSLRVVYESTVMAEDIMDELKCSEEYAWDWYGFNTLRGTPYCHTAEADCPEIICYVDEEEL